MSKDPTLDELDLVMAQIGATPAGQRHLMFSALDRAIRAAGRAGQSAPKDALGLRETLADEAIEAQFDNMPV